MKKKALTILFAFSFLASVPGQNYNWAISMGSNGDDKGNAITTDANGNVIVAGNFSGTVDFDPSSATQNLTSLPGANGLFVTKVSSTGNLIWSKSFDGASPYNWMRAIDTDANGNVYVVGDFGATTDFDPSPTGVFTLTPSGATDIFVAKLDASGNFLWAFQIGGMGNSDYCTSVVVDIAGDVHICGAFSQTVDFNPSATTNTLSSINGGDAFIARYSSAGNYLWAGRIGGGGGTWAASMVVDAAQNMYVTGWFNGTADLDPSASSFTLASTGAMDMFVCKIGGTGNLVWAKQIGSIGQEQPMAIALDGTSNIYITGSFEGSVDFDPSAATQTLTANAGKDIFLCKLDVNGAFKWAHSFGSTTPDNDGGEAIAVSAQGNVFITGGFYGTVDFDPAAGTSSVLTTAGGLDMFVSKFDGNGNLLWAKQLSGSSYDLGQGVAVDGAENVYTTGSFYNVADFDPSATLSYTLASAGLYDIFISKLSTDGITTGIQEANVSTAIATLYPNPASNLITLNTSTYENVQAILSDVSGKQVMALTLQSAQTTFNISDLSQGVYLLQLIQNNVPVYETKLIKQQKQ